MSINSINSNVNHLAYRPQNQQPIKEQNFISSNWQKQTAPGGDKFEKTMPYRADSAKVAAMKYTMAGKIDAFSKMVSTLFSRQGLKYNHSIGIRSNLENLIAGGVGDKERLAAQGAVSEYGEWGVEQTADRILDFAKALSGGDPSKIGVLKEAVMKGFAQAQAAWGGALPDICSATYAKVRQGFDEWEKQGLQKQ